MGVYKLSDTVDKNKVFIVKSSEIKERFDVSYFFFKGRLLDKFKFPLEKVKKHFIIKDGDHDKLPEKELSDELNGKRYLRAQDLKGGRILSEKPIYVSLEYFDKIKRCQIYPNDLLVSIMASLGLNVIVPDDFEISVANRAIGILRSKEKNLLLTKYLQVLLNTNVGFALFEIEKKGGIQQRLNLSDIGNVLIPIPPKDKQKAIVDIYSNAYIEQQQKEHAATRLLESIDSYLLSELGIILPQKEVSLQNRIFTTNFSKVGGNRLDPDYISKYEYLVSQKANYNFIKLKDLLVTSPQYGANEEAIKGNADTDIRYIRITDIDDLGNLKKDGWKTASNTDDRYLLKYNDLLFARSGSVGKCYIHKQTDQKAIFAGYLIRFVVDESKVNPDFIFYYCNSSIYKFWVSAIERPAVQSNINSEEFKSLPIPLPSIEKQNEIADHIAKIRSQAKQLQKEGEQVLVKAKQDIEKMILEL